MSTFKNKHLVVAMLVAPILAILAWYSIDALVGEKPKPAEEGKSYPLVEKPNCRYSSGACGLKNADFELELSIRALEEGLVELNLTSAFPLDGVMVSLVENDLEDAPPVAMQPRGGDGKTWSLDMQRPDPERHRLRLAALADGSIYYGDVATKFTLHQEPAATGN
jgi:hypothetical protein